MTWPTDAILDLVRHDDRVPDIVRKRMRRAWERLDPGRRDSKSVQTEAAILISKACIRLAHRAVSKHERERRAAEDWPGIVGAQLMLRTLAGGGVHWFGLALSLVGEHGDPLALVDQAQQRRAERSRKATPPTPM